jgi:heat shock protein HtpX
LRRTDFLAAARANQTRTRGLVVLLIITGTALGYLGGWTFELLAVPAHHTAEPLLFLGGAGMMGGAAMLALSAGWSVVALKMGDRIVLGLTGAHEVTAEQERRLHNVVEEMALAAGLPQPRIYVVETAAMNAFATGMRPNRAAIAVTRGLLDKLERDELQGVVGHEMGHIVNWDVRYATAVGVMVGVIALVSDALLRMLRFGTFGGRGRGDRASGPAVIVALMLLVLFALLAPLAAKLVQMAISRQREFLADATSVRLTRNPLGLIHALQKLAAGATTFPGVSGATQHLFIVNPLRDFGERTKALWATHPPVARRISRLRNLGGDT